MADTDPVVDPTVDDEIEEDIPEPVRAMFSLEIFFKKLVFFIHAV